MSDTKAYYFGNDANVGANGLLCLNLADNDKVAVLRDIHEWIDGI